MIQFMLGGKRRTIRLGKVTAKVAETIKFYIERLVSSKVTGVPVDDDTCRWVSSVDDVFYSKLVRSGLVDERESILVGPFVRGYVASRRDVKDSTRLVYGQTERCLLEFFGESRPIRDLSEGDADEWRLWLINHEKLADNTVRRRSGIAKQFFKSAVRKKLIASNPFGELVSAVRGNSKRLYFVSREEAHQILESCPDWQWRMIFALARFGGLRCPSEILALRWRDVDWNRNRITVHSSKTEHLPGGHSRLLPLFPELAVHLREPGTRRTRSDAYVITRYRKSGINLRTQLSKIIRKAGLEPWPKLFQNLRSSRETELAEVWPLHVVCAWIGNSQAVASKHYLQITEDHFDRAARGVSALQNALQHGAHLVAGYGNADSEIADCSINGRVGVIERDSESNLLGGTGLVHKNVSADVAKRLRESPEQRGANTGAHSKNHVDGPLREVIRVWNLPSRAAQNEIIEHIRRDFRR